MDHLCFLSSVCYTFVCVCLFVPCGHMTSWLSFVVSTVSMSLSHWYRWPGVVLDLSIPDLCTLTYFQFSTR